MKTVEITDRSIITKKNIISNPNAIINYIDIGQDDILPPLVILGGTAQTINSYGPHILNISKSRRLIIPELRCQGKI